MRSEKYTGFIFTSRLTARLPDGDLSLVDAADHCAFRGGQQHFKRLLRLLKVILNDLSLPAPL